LEQMRTKRKGGRKPLLIALLQCIHMLHARPVGTDMEAAARSIETAVQYNCSYSSKEEGKEANKALCFTHQGRDEGPLQLLHPLHH
jgi:hypothetical protein